MSLFLLFLQRKQEATEGTKDTKVFEREEAGNGTTGKCHPERSESASEVEGTQALRTVAIATRLFHNPANPCWIITVGWEIETVQAPLHISKTEAKFFLLKSHYLLGSKIRGVKEGISKVLGRLKAIQVDSIDVAGTNQDIALQSRVANYTPKYLTHLLYQERGAFEYWLKCLCIFPIDSFPFYREQMQRSRSWFDAFLIKHRDLADAILREIRSSGPKAPGSFTDKRQCRGGWFGSQRVVKKTLEVLWETGFLMIHHRNGRQRYYDLAERCIPSSKVATQQGAYQRKALLDLYSAMRLFSTRGSSSEIWHFVRGFRTAEHAGLEEDGMIVPVVVKGSRRQYFILKEDLPLFDSSSIPKARVRLLAPLDSMLWDRKMIKDIFDFECSFEVYKKPENRRFGYYCLPILYGTDFVGRCGLAREKQNQRLCVHGVHWEDGMSLSSELIRELARTLRDHMRFLGVAKITIPKTTFAGGKKLRALLP